MRSRASVLPRGLIDFGSRQDQHPRFRAGPPIMTVAELPAIHPGEILRELYLEPLALKPYSLAKKLGVPRTRIERIVTEKIGITTDTALRLAKFFRTTPQFWMNLQVTYEIKIQSVALAPVLAGIAERDAA